MPKLTVKQKEIIAELLAELDDYEYWFYSEQHNVFGLGGESLDDCVDKLKDKIALAEDACAYLKRLGLIPEERLQC